MVFIFEVYPVTNMNEIWLLKRSERNNIILVYTSVVYSLIYQQPSELDIELKLAISVWQQDLYILDGFCFTEQINVLLFGYTGMKINILNWMWKYSLSAFLIYIFPRKKNNYIYRPIQLIHKIP